MVAINLPNKNKKSIIIIPLNIKENNQSHNNKYMKSGSQNKSRKHQKQIADYN